MPLIRTKDSEETDEISDINQAEPVIIGEPVPSEETKPGYISTAIEDPEWIGTDRRGTSGWNHCCFDTEGDCIYLGCENGTGGYTGAKYDSISESWTEYQVPAGNAEGCMLDVLSVRDGAMWMCCLSGERGYYLIYTDLETLESRSPHIDFWDRSRCSYISDIKALDSDRALLFSDEDIWLIDSSAQLLKTITPDSLYPSARRIGDTLYIRTDTGIYPFDEEELSLGENFYTPENSYDGWLINSTDGNFYMLSTDSRTGDQFLNLYDSESGEKSLILSCSDTALSYYDSVWGNCLRNSQGCFIREGLVKTCPAEVPVKKPLKMLVMGQEGEKYYHTSELRISRELQEAIIHFNNSDPEFYIETVPLIYKDAADRDRLLMEIATSGDADLIDTSLLPDGALNEGLLVNLLPYIDADKDIGREDFIPSLLKTLEKQGGIYEFADSFVLITMYIPEELYPGKESWTVDGLRKLVRENPDRIPDSVMNNIPVFALAATGEFMDWDNMSCSFDSPLFINWLELIKALSGESGPETDSTGVYYGGKMLFGIDDSFSFGGPGYRDAVGGNYVMAGFPGADGTGSYFMKSDGELMKALYGPDDHSHFIAETCTQLGIMASGPNRDGAWRFMKTFMRFAGNDRSISPLKARFEEHVESWVKHQYPEDYEFTKVQPEDGKITRDLVYGTEKTVCTDKTVLDAIIAEINAFLGGKETAEEAASQIQSRMSIYMAEHS
ncbi:MAG: hypothetical protein ACOX68_07850 [Candidatus Limivicinus sp.]